MHAKGLFVDEEKSSDLLEHFGITTVETMSAGCVPIVINRGQPEIVKEGTGYVWYTLEQLARYTEEFAKDSKKYNQF